jgi:GNAT superfamily N-acetyltransferase
MPPVTAPASIRRLSPATDREAVAALYSAAADYILLESGGGDPVLLADEFFADAPPGGDPADGEKLGLFLDGRLAGIADLAFGWPEARDAYLGTMILAPDARGHGHGARFLREVERLAKARHAPRLLLAVLDGNPRGLAFWQREGFGIVRTFPPAEIGSRRHVRHRMEKRL